MSGQSSDTITKKPKTTSKKPKPVNTRAQRALRAVVRYENKRALDELDKLRAKLKEAKAVAPALFANKGDTFIVGYRYTFVYLGRTTDGNLKFICEQNDPDKERSFEHFLEKYFGVVGGCSNDVYTIETMPEDDAFRVASCRPKTWVTCDRCRRSRLRTARDGARPWRILRLPLDKCV